MVAIHQDGQHQSGVIGPRRAEFAAAIEEQRVKIAAIHKTIQPPAR